MVPVGGRQRHEAVGDVVDRALERDRLLRDGPGAGHHAPGGVRRGVGGAERGHRGRVVGDAGTRSSSASLATPKTPAPAMIEHGGGREQPGQRAAPAGPGRARLGRQVVRSWCPPGVGPPGTGRPGAARRRGRPRAAVPAARRRSRRPPALSTPHVRTRPDIFPQRRAQLLAGPVQPDAGRVGGDAEDRRDLGRASAAPTPTAAAARRRRAAAPPAPRRRGSSVRLRAGHRRRRRVEGRDPRGDALLAAGAALGVGEAVAGDAVRPRQRRPPAARRTAASRPAACRRGRRRRWPRRYVGPGTAAAARSARERPPRSVRVSSAGPRSHGVTADLRCSRIPTCRLFTRQHADPSLLHASARRTVACSASARAVATRNDGSALARA